MRIATNDMNDNQLILLYSYDYSEQDKEWVVGRFPLAVCSNKTVAAEIAEEEAESTMKMNQATEVEAMKKALTGDYEFKHQDGWGFVIYGAPLDDYFN